MPIYTEFVPGGQGNPSRLNFTTTPPGGIGNGWKSPVPPPPPKGGAILKFLGGLVASPAGLVLATGAFFFGNQKGFSDGTLPEHLRNPGERQKIEEGDPPPFKGGQGIGVKYRIRVNWEYRKRFVEGTVKTSEFLDDGRTFKGPITDISSPSKDGDGNLQVYVVFDGGNQEFYKVIGQSSGKTYVGDTIYFEAVPVDNTVDPFGDPPSPNPGVSSQSTIDFDNVEINKYGFDSGIRLVRDGAPAKIKPPNIKPPSIPEPTISTKSRIVPKPTPQPIPDPPPSLSEQSLEDNQNQDRQNEKDKDSKTTRVVTKKQTIEFGAKKKQIITENPAPNPERGIKNDPNLDNTDPIDLYDQKTRINQPENPKVIKKHFVPPPKPPSPPNKSKTKVEDPQPEADENEPPFIPPPPVNTPPDKCRGTCAGKNGVKLDELTALLSGTNTAQNTGIYALVKNTNEVINSTTFGLKRIQEFAETAWKATGADKITQVVGTIASLHNAAMLSQNAAQSIGDVATNGLQLFNIKGSDDQPIDVNEAVGGAIKNKLAAIFGEQNLKAASDVWLRLNRIHQAVSSTVMAIQGTKNALLEADEITGGHVAKIGNALQEQGLIEDDSYDFMNPQPNYQQPFKGILGKLDSIEEVTDRVSNVVSTGLEIKENTTELVTSSKELEDATSDFLVSKNNDENLRKALSVSPNIDRLDTIKHEPAEQE